ncbi:DUF7144 family membrane protein [Saccharothrix sp. ST-888]|uniref:DUF7144 family membrane protein n=1 Tax=Saccharothrix sp. ST-888 TaxID=1427391 RepID=UPI0005EC923C|nr:hypothetical protein [Saccharothrix sp. ST-888]KJK56918.1 hypothetical protein UK12_19785 [Saccharothrix sp. ST-888]
MSQASGPLHDPSGPAPAQGGGSHRPDRAGIVTGVVLFAGVMMLVNGLLGILQGIVAVAKDSVYVTTRQYTFEFSLTGWGWIHIVWGLVIAAVGYGVVKGAAWGRVLAILVVSVGLALNFIFLPYYPLWSLVVIAIDAFILWALCLYHSTSA